MKTMRLDQATESLGEYAGHLRERVLLVDRRNAPVAAVIPLKDVDRESASLCLNPEFMKLIETSRQQAREGKTISLEEMKKEFGKS